MATNATATDSSESPTHFWFMYRSQPKPGIRAWMRVDEETWVELYPDGSQSRYLVRERGEAFGQTGTVVRKVSGDVRETLTPNDGSFEAFIPDQGNAEAILGFRNFQNGAWGDWQPLTRIDLIE